MRAFANRIIGSGFNLGQAVSRYDESLTLIAVLDHLRDAYDLAKDAGHADIQSHLMEARRKLYTSDSTFTVSLRRRRTA